MSTNQPNAIATKRFAPPSSANPGPAPGQYEVRPLDKPRGVLPLGKQSKNRFEVCKVAAHTLLSACCQSVLLRDVLEVSIFGLEVPHPYYTCTDTHENFPAVLTSIVAVYQVTYSILRSYTQEDSRYVLCPEEADVH